MEKKKSKRAYLIFGIIVVAVAGGWLLHRELTKGKQDTDDAQVEADVVPLAARVGGTVKEAKVTDNQLVKAGDILFEIDPVDLDVEVAKAQADLDAARAQAAAADAQVTIVTSSSKGGLSAAKASVEGAGASVRTAASAVAAAQAAIARAKSDLQTAESDLARTQQLAASGAATKRDVEHAQAARDSAKAALDVALAQLQSAQDQRGMALARVAEAQGHVESSAPVDQQVAAATAAAQLAAAHVKAAESALDKAKLQRSYATVKAPTGGLISRLGAHAGQQIMMGQTLLMLVPLETYVVANFKEGQVGDMKAGDEVEIEVDAFPGQSFAGIVDTVSPATGARFSLIPPDNATGNFVKVVQRVPVKIRWKTPPKVSMRPGLSADVTVTVK